MLNTVFKTIRREQGITISTLASLSQVQPGRIKAFENRNANITVKTLVKLLRSLNHKLTIAKNDK